MTTGAEQLVRAAAEAGIDTCFANPGTTEMPVVAAIDAMGGIKGVLGLHENVCTGAADGYGRIAGKPALTLLHLGPGFANGIANLHNARRARTPIVNIIGEHASWHLSADAPLHTEIELLTGVVSRWTRRVARAEDMARDMDEAIAAATAREGGIATLIVPHDFQLGEAGRSRTIIVPDGCPAPDPTLIEAAAKALRGASRGALLLDGNALYGKGLETAGRIAAALGVTLLAAGSFAKLESGKGRPPVTRVPYFPELAQACLDQFDCVVLCGAEPPVSFFGYGDKPSRYLDGRDGVVMLAGRAGDACANLVQLADALDAGATPPARSEAPALSTPGSAPLDVDGLCTALALGIPDDAVVVLTAVSSGRPFDSYQAAARPHTQIALTGGAIGSGLAMACGAAVAAPGRRVIALEADGSGAYINQALWTQAHEGLDVTSIICANQRYAILQTELSRAGIANPGPNAMRMTGLVDPALDWVSLAKGYGVPGERVTNARDLLNAIKRSTAASGPYLIEAML